MQKSTSTGTFHSMKHNSKKKRKSKANRRSSVGDASWPPQRKWSDMQSSSQDWVKPKQQPQHALGEFETPRGRAGEKKTVNLTPPKTANARLNTSASLLSPITPRRSRTSAKLKMLWPPLDPSHVNQEAQHSINVPTMSPSSRCRSSPFQSPTAKKTLPVPGKRVSESAVYDIGKTILSATGKRRTLRGVWPPPNLKSSKQKQPSETTQPGITEIRKSMLNRSNTFGSTDGEGEKRNKQGSPKKPTSVHTLMSASTTSSSNEEWASMSDLNDGKPLESATSTPTKPQSSLSKETVTEKVEFVSLDLPSGGEEADGDSNDHSGRISMGDNTKKYIHSWEIWTDLKNKPDHPGDSPVFTPTNAAVPLGAKTDVSNLPKAPDLVMSPHDRNRISFSQSSTPSNSGSTRSRQRVFLPTIAKTTDLNDSGRIDSSRLEEQKNEIAAEPKIDRPPIHFSEETSDEVVKNDPEPKEPKSEKGSGATITETANPTALQEDAPPTANDTVAIPLLPQTEDAENSQHSDDGSVWSSEDEGPGIDERSLDGKDDEGSTDADPTSPTVDTEDSWIPADRDIEELELPQFILPKQLPPKTRVMGKRKRTEYRIRWEGPTSLDLSVYYPLITIPEVEDLPERDDRFEKSKSDSGIAMPMRSNRSLGDSQSLESLFSSDQSAGSVDEKSETESLSSTHSRPSIHVTPVEEDEEEREDSKWKLKRVWDLEEMDQKETEHTVPRSEVMPSVKELCGVRDDIELNDETPWVIQRVNFIGDEEIELEEEEAFTADEMMQQMETITSKRDTSKHRRKGKIKAKKSEKTGEKTKTTSKDQKKEKKPQKKKEKPKKRKSRQRDEEKSENTNKFETADKSGKRPQKNPEAPRTLKVPNGQKLPPLKRKKGRRANYQLRYDGPTDLQLEEMFSIPENRFKGTDADSSMMRRPVRRGSGSRDALGESEEHGQIPARPTRRSSSVTGRDESNHGDLDERGIKRPQLLMTPRKVPAPEKMKWTVRRVWDIEEYDEKEDDHSVFDQDLATKVRELFGVPNDEDLAAESRFLGGSSPSDSAPFLLRRIHDIDGEIDEVEVGVEFGTKYLQKALDHVNAEAKETVMWWDTVIDSEPKKKPAFKIFIGKVKEPWHTHNVENEKKPKIKRIMPWEKRATPKKKVEQYDSKMWWED